MKRENMMVNYVAPKVRVVEFKVESGFAGSGPTGDNPSQDMIPPMNGGTERLSSGGTFGVTSW